MIVNKSVVAEHRNTHKAAKSREFIIRLMSRDFDGE